MSSQKYISVKVFGNHQANAGFNPLVWFNATVFTVEDRAISGFQANSYFFSLKIERTQVVYKLYKNNVRSYDSIRAGSLVIAFSVPKDYGFEEGVGPYQVMMALKDKFLSSCMTCRDSVKETYEFNAQIDSNVLDDVAQRFPLIPHECPYCVMSTDGPVGHLILPENKIEQFLNDVQYREMQKYSEVFIAEKVEDRVSLKEGTTFKNSSPVPDLVIPRTPQYKIAVDGKLEPVVTDINKLLSYSSQAKERFYVNGTVTFTIKELQAGKNPDPDHVKFFPVLEEIQVTTAGLEEPKVRSFQLVLDPYQDFFKDCYNSLQLIYDRTVKLKLDKDLSFELKGEQIGYCDRPSAFSIKYSGEGQSDYRFIADKFDADQLVFTVQKNEYGGGPKPPLYKPGGNKGPSGDTQNAMSRRLILNIKDKDGEIFEGGYSIKVRIKCDSGIFEKKVNFSQNGKTYQGKIEVPEQIESPMDVEFYSVDGSTRYKFVNPVSFRPREKEIRLETYQPYPERLMDKKISKKLGLLGLLAAALLLLGGLAGYGLRGCTTQDNNEPPVKEGNNNENKNDSVDGPDIPRSEELSKEQAIAIMNSWLETLQKDDVTFDEIEKVFKVYSNNEASYKNYCSENDILRITDYYDVCTCIKNGAFDELKKRWNVYKLYINHHNKLYQMVEGTIINGKSKAFSKNELKEAKDLFMNNFSSYSSFANIRLYQPASNASQNNSGGGNSGGGKSSGGKSGGKSGGGKPDNSNPSTGTNAPTR